MDGYRYLMPTQIYFGRGVVDQVGQRSVHFGKKALLVTGRKSSQSSGALDAVLASLERAALEVELFDRVEENPTDRTVSKGAQVARERGCDVVVALGGGSPMDAAKGIAILACLDGELENYYGAGKITLPLLPVIALPTTAGTGSEVTPYAVFVQSEKNIKRSVASSHIFPRVALLDPDLTVTLPPDITANTGIDALTHALEGFTSTNAQPISDLLALEAMALIHRHLPSVVSDGQDLKARGFLLHASMLAGIVIAQTGTTLIHGMGYAPTTQYGIPHGLANGILMDQVVIFNGRHDPGRYRDLATALGKRADASSGPQLVAEALGELREKVGMPHRFRDLGVKKEDVETFAHQTMRHTRNLENNPRRVDLQNILEIYEKTI